MGGFYDKINIEEDFLKGEAAYSNAAGSGKMKKQLSGIERIALLAVELNRQALREKVENAARLCLLDTLGVGIYGSAQPEANLILDTAKRLGSGKVLVWGSGDKLDAGMATMVCGSLCHLRELDDVHYAILHTGCVCVPAAMAAAQLEKANLGQLLHAVVSGVEVMARISLGMDYMNHREQGWHGTATCGAFGGAAAVGCLLGLNEIQLADALGIAGSRTGGTWAFSVDGTMSKRLHPGQAARDGLLAAYLAQAGITGPHYVLEAEDGGFYRLFAQEWNIERALAPRNRTAIEDVEYKWFASCKSVHSPITAARQIHQSAPSRGPGEVRRVLVEVNYSALSMAGHNYTEDSVVSAQISIPYGIALGLLGRTGQGADYTMETLKDPMIQMLANKVIVVESEEFNLLRETEHLSGARVTVEWTDGEYTSATVKNPKGSLANPLTSNDIMEKFMSLTQPLLGQDGSERLMKLVMEGSPDTEIEQLIQCLICRDL